MTKKTIIVSSGAASLGIAALIGIGTAGAATQGNTLATKIASAFHLNATDVQKVIDQDRKDHQAVRQQKVQNRLDQAVTDGKITSVQEKLILDKLAELESKRQSMRDSLKDKTPAERKAAMEQERADLEAWAKTNNIPLEYLRPLGRGMGRPHFDFNK